MLHNYFISIIRLWGSQAGARYLSFVYVLQGQQKSHELLLWCLLNGRGLNKTLDNCPVLGVTGCELSSREDRMVKQM